MGKKYIKTLFRTPNVIYEDSHRKDDIVDVGMFFALYHAVHQT